jgi:hypothetical protein
MSAIISWFKAGISDVTGKELAIFLIINVAIFLGSVLSERPKNVLEGIERFFFSTIVVGFFALLIAWHQEEPPTIDEGHVSCIPNDLSGLTCHFSGPIAAFAPMPEEGKAACKREKDTGVTCTYSAGEIASDYATFLKDEADQIKAEEENARAEVSNRYQ